MKAHFSPIGLASAIYGKNTPSFLSYTAPTYIYLTHLRYRFEDWLKGSHGKSPPPSGSSTQDYAEWYYNRPLARAYFNSQRRIRNLTDIIERANPTRVFEFGSGLGHVLQEARRRGIEMTGTETSEYALTHSLCSEAMVKITEIPPGRLPFQDSSFDLIFSTEVMEHVTESATLPVLKELRRICSNRAIFTINTFDVKEFGHINIHPRKWWDDMFAATGFVPDQQLWRDVDRIKMLNWDIFALKIATKF